MLPLPLEVLTLAFKYLGRKDLLQCQLTSKQWYKASVDRLYSNVKLYTNKKSSLYIRTISNSLILGSHLKIINTHALFQMGENRKWWDEHGLLDVVIQNCPNLLRIDSVRQDLQFWFRISYAASQGQLSRLQRLPASDSKSLECYVYTALLFKKTLKHLSIIDDKLSSGTDLNHIKLYPALLDQLNEFKNLETIAIRYFSDKQLSCFDELIENHPHLREVTLKLVPIKEHGIIIEPKEPIQPHPNIRSLTCNWEAIKNPSQLKYVMQKFPNLQNLKISSVNCDQTRPAYCPSSAIIEFWQYAIAIPNNDFCIDIRDQEAMEVWNEFINVKRMYKDINIGFINWNSFTRNPIFEPRGTKLSVRFPIHEDDIEYKHLKYFLKSGNTIRSLTLDGLNDPFDSGMDPSSPAYVLSSDIDCIFQVLRLCPSLQELIMPLPDEMIELSNHVLQNTTVTKLTISNFSEINDYVEFLKFMSLKLPNLKKLHLMYISTEEEVNGSPATINMPNTNFDLIYWEHLDAFSDLEDSFTAYIKVQTEYDIRFYIGNKSGAFPIKIRQYHQAVNKDLFRFHITCKSLKELRFFRNTNSIRFRWIF